MVPALLIAASALTVVPADPAGPGDVGSLFAQEPDDGHLPFSGWSVPSDASGADRETCESILCGDCGDTDCGGPVRIRFSIPSWIPEAHGTTVARGREAPVNVSTRSLFRSVDDLNFIVAGRAELTAGRWGLIGDGFFVNMQENSTVAGDRINLSAGFRHSIAEGALKYSLTDPAAAAPGAHAIDLLAGARYWLLEADQLTLTGPQGNSVSASGKRQWVDPIIGARIGAPCTEDLLFQLRGDIGGFGAASDFTWNVEALGEFRCSDCCGLQLGYRVLDVDYARGSGFAYDVNYRGPIAILVFDF